jgi:hypothetical protein
LDYRPNNKIGKMLGMADNQKLPGIEIEVGPVVCGRCKRTFAYLVIEEIDGFLQL